MLSNHIKDQSTNKFDNISRRGVESRSNNTFNIGWKNEHICEACRLRSFIHYFILWSDHVEYYIFNWKYEYFKPAWRISVFINFFFDPITSKIWLVKILRGIKFGAKFLNPFFQSLHFAEFTVVAVRTNAFRQLKGGWN